MTSRNEVRALRKNQQSEKQQSNRVRSSKASGSCKNTLGSMERLGAEEAVMEVHRASLEIIKAERAAAQPDSSQVKEAEQR